MSDIQTRIQRPNVVRYTGASARPTAGDLGGGGVTGRDIWRILRKRKWQIILPIIISTVLTAGGTALWLKYKPYYKAKAYLRISQPDTGPMSPVQRAATTDVIERLAMDSARMVKREPVLDKALAQIPDTVWLSEDKDNARERLENAATATAIPGTGLIEIAVTIPQKDEAPDIATAIAKAYVEFMREQVGQHSITRLNSLEREIGNLQTQLDYVRGEMGKLRAKVSLADMQRLGGIEMVKLQTFARQLIDLKADKSAAQQALDAMLNQTPDQRAELPEVVHRLDVDPQLRGLYQTEITLSVELDNAKREHGPEHRTRKMLESKLGSVQKQLAERRKKLIDYQVQALIGLRQMAVQGITAQQVDVQKEYNQTDAYMKEIGMTIARMTELESREKGLVRNMERIAQRRGDLSLAAQNEERVSIASLAETPREPAFPKWRITMPLGVLLGLVFGLSLAFLLEFMDTSIKSPADMLARVDLPILGMVPHADDLEGQVDDVRTAVAGGADPLLDEAFRQIRTCLQFSAPAEQRKTILITSAHPDDGRTSVSLNLAACIAQAGQKVLVIDTNFRQPVASQLLGGRDSDGEGLSSVLVGQINWQSVVREADGNLHILPAGQLPPNPAELLGSEQMRTVLAECAERYDQVILDSAPCLVVADASILSGIVDGVVLVVRAQANTYGVVQRTKAMLSRLDAKILGAVLNGVRTAAGGYLRENYRTFYDYQAQAKLPSD